MAKKSSGIESELRSNTKDGKGYNLILKANPIDVRLTLGSPLVHEESDV
jgi:hypothetical protein